MVRPVPDRGGHRRASRARHRSRPVPGTHGLDMLTNRSAPPATITPVLIYPDVRAAVAWLEAAFGFGERVRIGEDHRAQMRACDQGARVLEQPTTFEYGERSCVVEDPAGHRWELTQTVRDVHPDEWGGVLLAPW